LVHYKPQAVAFFKFPLLFEFINGSWCSPSNSIVGILSQSLQSKGTLEHPYLLKELNRNTAHATSLTMKSEDPMEETWQKCSTCNKFDHEKWASYGRILTEIKHMQHVWPWSERHTEISSVSSDWKFGTKIVEIQNPLIMCRFGCGIYPALSILRAMFCCLIYPSHTARTSVGKKTIPIGGEPILTISQKQGSFCHKMTLLSSKAGQEWVGNQICLKYCAYRNLDMKQPTIIYVFVCSFRKGRRERWMQTWSAPMPAFPRVHIDGAVANALARAFLQRVETIVTIMQSTDFYNMRTREFRYVLPFNTKSRNNSHHNAKHCAIIMLPILGARSLISNSAMTNIRLFSVYSSFQISYTR